MTKYIRVALIVAVAIFSIFIANNIVSKANSNPEIEGSRSVQPLDQPAQLQNPVVQEQTGETEESVSPQNQSEKAEFVGLVWNDFDQDGVQDLGENGIPLVAVNLYNSSRELVGTTNTDRNGIYSFKNLDPGEYYAVILLPESYVFSPQDRGVNELVDSDADPNTAATSLVTFVAGDNDLVWTTGLYSLLAVDQSPGTVQPPPSDIFVCDPGIYSLGGISTLRLNPFADDYCLHAFLWNHAFSIGIIPGGAGRVLAEVTFLEVYYQERFVHKYEVAGEAGNIQVCYAVPIGMQAQIYFFDFYGPKFGEQKGQSSWEALQTAVENGIACAPAQTSGAYALIGK